MSGHSKWSKVKHQKEATDAARGKIFTKIANNIIVAVRQGGGITDPDANFKLRIALDRARQVNMPKDNIQRAIERAKGTSGEAAVEEVIYEAFGPGGVGMIITGATDNKQRTVAEVKNILDRHGGVLVSSGAVSHLFRLKGLIELEKKNKTFDEIMEEALNLGAVDLKEEGEKVEVYTTPSDLHKVKEALIKFGVEVISAEMVYLPVSFVDVSDPGLSEQLTNLVTLLDEHEDVQKVFVNAR